MWKILFERNTEFTLKMIFGYALLVVLGALAFAIALGKVEEHASFGLPFVLGALSTISGGFTTWAFSNLTKTAARPTLPEAQGILVPPQPAEPETHS